MTRSHQQHRTGAFFGRRKGHALRPRQAALFDTLLPKLALDLSKPAPPDLRTLFDGADDVRLESGFGGGEHLMAEAERNPRTGFIGIEPFVNGMAKALASIDERKLTEHPAASRRCDRRAGLAAVRDRSPASISSIPIRGRSGGTGNAASCRTKASLRSRGSCVPQGEFRFASDIPDYVALDTRAGDALAAFHMDRRASRRLAQAVARLHQHALRGQGQAPGPRALLSDFRTCVGRNVRRRCWDRGPARSARRVARSRARASRSSNRPRRAPGWKRSCRPDATR